MSWKRYVLLLVAVCLIIVGLAAMYNFWGVWIILTQSYKYNKRWRLRHPDKFAAQNKRGDKRYKRRYPGRFSYSNKVHRLLSKGAMKRGTCIICDSSMFVQCCTHFNKDPFHPVWLCDRCNKSFHLIARERGLKDGNVHDGMVILYDLQDAFSMGDNNNISLPPHHYN